MKPPKRTSVASNRASRPLFDLSLYVAGITSRSLRTIQNVKRACEEHALGKYNLHVVDIHRQPELAVANQIVAVPTLVCSYPQPTRHFVGHSLSPSDILRKLTVIPVREQQL